MRVTPPSRFPEQQSWCYDLQCSVAGILVVLTAWACSLLFILVPVRPSWPIIPLNQFLLRAPMTSISPNPAVPSLSSPDSASQLLSSMWHSLLQLLQYSLSWLLRTSLVLWVLLLPPWLLFLECYVLTPPQGWTFESCIVTGFHWAIFSSASTLPFLSQALNTIYTTYTTLPSFFLLTLTFPLDSRLVYSTAYWTGSLGSWLLSWIFCSQSFSFLFLTSYTNELIICRHICWMSFRFKGPCKGLWGNIEYKRRRT